MISGLIANYSNQYPGNQNEASNYENINLQYSEKKFNSWDEMIIEPTNSEPDRNILTTQKVIFHVSENINMYLNVIASWIWLTIGSGNGSVRSKIQWYLNQDTTISIQGNAFGNVIYKMAAICLRTLCIIYEQAVWSSGIFQSGALFTNTD